MACNEVAVILDKYAPPNNPPGEIHIGNIDYTVTTDVIVGFKKADNSIHIRIYVDNPSGGYRLEIYDDRIEVYNEQGDIIDTIAITLNYYKDYKIKIRNLGDAINITVFEGKDVIVNKDELIADGNIFSVDITNMNRDKIVIHYLALIISNTEKPIDLSNPANYEDADVEYINATIAVLNPSFSIDEITISDNVVKKGEKITIDITISNVNKYEDGEADIVFNDKVIDTVAIPRNSSITKTYTVVPRNGENIVKIINKCTDGIDDQVKFNVKVLTLREQLYPLIIYKNPDIAEDIVKHNVLTITDDMICDKILELLEELGLSDIKEILETQWNIDDLKEILSLINGEPIMPNPIDDLELYLKLLMLKVIK